MNPDQARRLARFHLDIAHALHQAREQAGLSVESLAERAGLEPVRTLEIEEGDTTSLTEAAQVCDALGIGIATLFAERTADIDCRDSVTRVA